VRLGGRELSWVRAGNRHKPGIVRRNRAFGGAAALAHVGCAELGIGFGLLMAPPATRRPNAAFVVIAVYAVLAVPLYDLAPVLSPVPWLAATLTDAAARTRGAAVVLGALVAFVQAGLALAAGDALRRRAG
jgi:hypothetical protein